MLITPTSPPLPTMVEARAAFASAELCLEAATTAANEARAALTAAAADQSRALSLPTLRARRDEARKAASEAAERVEVARAALDAAKARQRADEARLEQERKAAEARAEDEARRAEHTATLAGPLAELDAARAAADAANEDVQQRAAARRPVASPDLVAFVLGSRTAEDMAEEHARIRATLAAEKVSDAADAVKAIDARHPAIKAARAQVEAMAVHGPLAEVAPALALLAAARLLTLEAFDIIGSATTKHTAANVPLLTLVRVLEDASERPLPIVYPERFGAPMTQSWAGICASEREALSVGAALLSATERKGVPTDEAVRLLLAGRVHELAGLSAAREREDRIRRLAADSDNASLGPVAVARAARDELVYARMSGNWHGSREVREPELLGRFADGARFVSDQVRAQVHAAPLGPFMVRTSPGAPAVVRLDQLMPPMDMGASLALSRSASPASPREQVIAYLGVKDHPDLARLVPDPAARRAEINPVAAAAE